MTNWVCYIKVIYVTSCEMLVVGVQVQSSVAKFRSLSPPAITQNIGCFRGNQPIIVNHFMSHTQSSTATYKPRRLHPPSEAKIATVAPVKWALVMKRPPVPPQTKNGTSHGWVRTRPQIQSPPVWLPADWSFCHTSSLSTFSISL